MPTTTTTAKSRCIDAYGIERKEGHLCAPGYRGCLRCGHKRNFQTTTEK